MLFGSLVSEKKILVYDDDGRKMIANMALQHENQGKHQCIYNKLKDPFPQVPMPVLLINLNFSLDLVLME